jgi:putative transcriptional regulator
MVRATALGDTPVRDTTDGRSEIRNWLARAAIAGLVILIAAQAIAGHRSTAGRLLVASHTMSDPRFVETVIFMIEHDTNGALGLIVNRPLGAVPVARLLERLGENPDPQVLNAMRGDIVVHTGGPVEPGRVFILHSPDVMVRGSKTIAANIAVTVESEMLLLIGQGAGPKERIFVTGYSGWGPGQLDGELAGADWAVIPADRDLVFAANPGKTWLEALSRRGVEL